jgi:thymidylate synthase ThyX
MSIEEFYNKWHNGAHHSSGNHKKIRMCNEDSGEIEHTNVVDIWQNGIKPVFRVTLENGYSTKMTKDHLCMTKDGWLTLEQSTGVKVNKNENGVTWNFSPEFAINGAYKVAQLVRSYSKLEKIEFAGYEMTYDLEVAGPYHNFVCDGFIVHNSVNEYSGRYSEMKDIAYFPDPEQVLAQSQTNKQGRDGELDLEVVTEYINKLKDAWHDSYEDYQSFLESDITRELARIGLPLNICTEFYWKMNLHNLMHFLKLRADSHAQYEIRVYAEAMAEIAKEVAPMAMASWENHVKNGMGISANEREFIANGIRVTHQTGIFTDGFLDAMAAMVVEMKWSRPRTREVMIKIADIRGEPHDVWVGKYLDRVVKPAVQK